MGSGSSPKTLPRRLLGGGIAVAVVGGGAWFALDRLAASLLDQMRPQLEQQLSKPLGHPLRIGEYLGLRFWGIALGPTTVEPGPGDASTASVQSVGIAFDPLASLQRWKPVAVVRLQGTRLNLRRNAQGAYWVPGSGGDEPSEVGSQNSVDRSRPSSD